MTLDSIGKLGIGTTSPDERLEVTGNIKLSGEINRTTTGVANLVPICYGSINTGTPPTITSGTGNFSVTSVFTGQYEITITGEVYTTTGYITIVTPVNTAPIIVSTSQAGLNKLLIGTFTHAGASINTDFHFAVFKQ